jgi:hypothetical protein
MTFMGRNTPAPHSPTRLAKDGRRRWGLSDEAEELLVELAAEGIGARAALVVLRARGLKASLRTIARRLKELREAHQ